MPKKHDQSIDQEAVTAPMQALPAPDVADDVRRIDQSAATRKMGGLPDPDSPTMEYDYGDGDLPAATLPMGALPDPDEEAEVERTRLMSALPDPDHIDPA